MFHQIETTNKYIKVIKKNKIEILEQKNTVSEIKKKEKTYQKGSKAGLIRWKKESLNLKIGHLRNRKKKERRKIMKRALEACSVFKCMNTHIMGIPGENRAREVRKNM